MELIKLSDYGAKIGEISSFKNELKNRIKDRLFNFHSFQDINYLALLQIFDKDRTLENSPESIEIHSKKVVEHFKQDVNRSTLFHSLNEKRKRGEVISFKEFFQVYFLELDKIPSLEHQKLRKNIEKHLIELNELIHHYETLPVVEKYRSNGKIINNKIILFYTRAINKRQEVLDHYIYSSYDRALERCAPDHPVIKMLRAFEVERDYPYTTLLDHEKFIDRCDYRKIDCYSHRLFPLSVENHFELEDVTYISDERSFYQNLFKLKSIDSFFNSISNNLDQLPIHDHRKSAFNELRFLFDNGKWMSFYIVGIAQVEGLFTDMIKSTQSKKKGGLVVKINDIRKKHFIDRYDLDYFEFVLPEQRNTLLHNGIDEELDGDGYKLKSYDILTDLAHVARLFTELEVPIVYIKHILNRKNTKEFSNIESLIKLFQNHIKIKKINPDEYVETLVFISDDINKELALLEVVKLTYSRFEQDYMKIKELISKDLISVVSLGELFKSNKDKFKKLSGESESSEIIESHFQSHAELYERFSNYFILINLFFSNYQELFVAENFLKDKQKSFRGERSNIKKLLSFYNYILEE